MSDFFFFNILFESRGVNSFLKLGGGGGQVVMRRATAARRRLLLCQNLGGGAIVPPPVTPLRSTVSGARAQYLNATSENMSPGYVLK